MRLLGELEPRLGGAGTHALATWRSFYGSVLLAEGRVEEAHQLVDQLVAELGERLPKSLSMARALSLRAGALLALGRFAESADDAAVALQLWAAGSGAGARPSTFDVFHLRRARAAWARRCCGGPAELGRARTSSARYGRDDRRLGSEGAGESAERGLPRGSCGCS
ncbi:MAG TPA: hypothetical protein VFN67_20475 [Polyangiales bacterium]|nr:hypothetical protein [Polyangiales bacterium]